MRQAPWRGENGRPPAAQFARRPVSALAILRTVGRRCARGDGYPTVGPMRGASR
jgi:hypothetical protein